MKKQISVFVPMLILVGLIVWLLPRTNRISTGPRTPCDDPEYLALKDQIARANSTEREALLRHKGASLRFLEEERSECLKRFSEYTPMSENQRATTIAFHKTQIAGEATRAPHPIPLFPPDYEGPYPTIPVPTVHSDEFAPSPISWRLMWRGNLTIVQVGLIGESGISRGKAGLLVWWPNSQRMFLEIVPLADRPLPLARLDIVTVCKPFVVVAGRAKRKDAEPYIWVFDLSKKSVRSVTRSQAPCWDPAYEQRDPTKLGD